MVLSCYFHSVVIRFWSMCIYMLIIRQMKLTKYNIFRSLWNCWQIPDASWEFSDSVSLYPPSIFSRVKSTPSHQPHILDYLDVDCEELLHERMKDSFIRLRLSVSWHLMLALKVNVTIVVEAAPMNCSKVISEQVRTYLDWLYGLSLTWEDVRWGC